MKTYREWLQEANDDDVAHGAMTIPTGLAPTSHMGHAIDLGGALSKTGARIKVINMSNKSGPIPDSTKRRILRTQLKTAGHNGIQVRATPTIGDSIRNMKERMNKEHPGKRHVLHLVSGGDRADKTEAMKKNIQSGGMVKYGIHPKDWHEIHVHTPENPNRPHGFSGTNMRAAAADGNIAEYHRHIGPGFNRDEAERLMNRVGGWKRRYDK
tara:strand:- start:528 stop:1160 length:633 start_codon:yes stop_codon:yes gene_type:complete